MKKTVNTILTIAFIVFLIVWGLIGIKILGFHDYDFITEAYIAMICYIIIAICVFYKIFNNKCSHCGRHLLWEGEYCSYCGKKLK